MSAVRVNCQLGEHRKGETVRNPELFCGRESQIDHGKAACAIIVRSKGNHAGRGFPLQTAQGERVALASSESIPAGATMEFTIQLLMDEHEKAVREWLDYGALRGIGQWRNSGKGRFLWEEI